MCKYMTLDYFREEIYETIVGWGRRRYRFGDRDSVRVLPVRRKTRKGIEKLKMRVRGAAKKK